MKVFLTTMFLTVCAAATLSAQKSDTIDALPYLVIDNDPTIIWTYRVGDAAFLDVFSREKTVINVAGVSIEYSMRIRKFSTNAFDTAYYRLAEIGYLRGFRFSGPKGFRESVVLPRRVYAGQTWMESDSGWSYRVTAIDDTLQTPAATYRNLIAVTATPVKTSDTAAVESRIYFAKGIGMVASTVNGKVQVYLASMKRVTGVVRNDH